MERVMQFGEYWTIAGTWGVEKRMIDMPVISGAIRLSIGQSKFDDFDEGFVDGVRQYVAGRFFLEFADYVDDRFSLLAHLGADDLVIGVVGIARGLSVGSNGFRLGTCAGHLDDRRPEVRG